MSFRKILEIYPPMMISTAVATISRMSEMGKFKIMTSFLCCQSTAHSSTHTNHLTAGFIYGSSWTSHPMNDTRSGMFFPVDLFLARINPKTSTHSYSQDCTTSVRFKLRVYIFGMLFEMKSLSRDCFLRLILRMGLQWPTCITKKTFAPRATLGKI